MVDNVELKFYRLVFFADLIGYLVLPNLLFRLSLRSLRVNFLSFGVNGGLLRLISLGYAQEKLIGFVLWEIVFEEALKRERVVLDGDAASALPLSILKQAFVHQINPSILGSG